MEKYEIWIERRMVQIRWETCPKSLTSAEVILILHGGHSSPYHRSDENNSIAYDLTCSPRGLQCFTVVWIYSSATHKGILANEYIFNINVD